MTPERIRAAAQTLRVTCLPVLRGHEDDWVRAVDISEALGDVLDRIADSATVLEAAGFAVAELQEPEYRAIFALVAKIEEAHL